MMAGLGPMLVACCSAASAIVAAAAADAAPPVITRLSTTSFPVEGGATVAVHGSGFDSAGSAALCRVENCGAGYATGDFTYAGNPGPNASSPANPPNMFPGPSVVEFNASVASDSLLHCTPPPVIASACARFSVSTMGNWSAPATAEYVQLFDVAVGRRPYITEDTGHLLLRCNASLLGARVSVTATLVHLPAAATHDWHWQDVALNGSNVLEFALSTSLPATVNTDLRITFTLPDGSTVVKWRRFMRAPAPPSGVVPTQVDHHRRGLLVGGEPFVGVGWYTSVTAPPANSSLQGTELWELLSRQSIVGDNQMMPYFFSGLTHEQRVEFLEYCETLGLKVMIPLDVNVAYASLASDPAKHDAWVGNITTYMNYTAVLGGLRSDQIQPEFTRTHFDMGTSVPMHRRGSSL